MQPRNLSRRTGALVIAIALMVLVSGCGRPSGTVTGKVTYQGKSLKGGTVAYISTEGQPSGTAMITEEGTYEVANLKAGNYQVVVDTESLLPKSGSTPYGGKAGMPPRNAKTMAPPPGANIPEGYKPMNIAEAEAAQKEAAKKYVKIPLNYSKPDESGLTYTVVGGSQTNDIDLK
jgi:hypothetical protein